MNDEGRRKKREKKEARMRKSTKRSEVLKAAEADWIETARVLLAAAGYILDLSDPKGGYVPAMNGDEVYYRIDNKEGECINGTLLLGPFAVVKDAANGPFELLWRGKRLTNIEGQPVDLTRVCKARRDEVRTLRTATPKAARRNRTRGER
jgi:hypothetical protein